MSILRTTFAAAVVCSAACAQAQLTNPSFESSGVGTTFDSWEEFNAGGIVVDFTSPRTGSVAASLNGIFADDGGVPPNPTQSDVGLFQELPASEGEYWQASAWSQVPVTLNPADIGILILEFRDSGGGLLGNAVAEVANDSTPTGVYKQDFVEGYAPAGTVAARILLLHVQLGQEPRGEVVIWDDAALEQVPPPPGLINPGFEQSGPDLPPAPPWIFTGGNHYVTQDVACDGVNNLKMFGQFNGADNTTVVYQEQPAAPGEEWIASIETWQFTGDSITGTNTAFMSIVFQDAGGAVLLDSPITVGDLNSALDTWVPYSITETAPAGTARAQLVLGFNQTLFEGGAVYFDCGSFTQDGTDVLENGGFETQGVSSTFLGWTDIGGNIFRETLAPRTGANHAKAFGDFTGAVNTVGASQALPASPGDEWDASAWGYLDFVDGLLGNNNSYIELNFLDASDTVLATNQVELMNPAIDPFGFYVQKNVTAIAPAGTTQAQIAIYMEQDAANSGGSVYWDDAALDCLSGDCGANPCIADVTTTGAGVGDPGYGVPDGQVTGADIQYFVNFWVAGDANVADVTTTGAGVGDPGYGVPDGQVTGADIQFYVNAWVAGCP